jgi:hypothetical protein
MIRWMSRAGLLVLCGAAFAESATPAQSPSPPTQGTSQAQSASPAQGTAPAKAPAKPKRAVSGACGAPANAKHTGTAGPAPAAHNVHSRYRPERFAGRAGTYYRLVWGVDDLIVRWGESGEVVRFSYRVLDAAKAKALNDKKNEPSLIDPERGVKLVVPSMENVGQLRQSAAPENGKAYWMVFSNKGRLVRRGDHVSVVIGAFHADGLVVD